MLRLATAAGRWDVQLNAPGIQLDKPPTDTSVGFNINVPATTLSYSVDLLADVSRPLAPLQVLLDSFAEELSQPGPVGS